MLAAALCLSPPHAPLGPAPPGCPMTSLLSCTSWSMSCSRNHVTFRRIKVPIRFQWITFRRQRMLLQEAQARGPPGSGVSEG